MGCLEITRPGGKMRSALTTLILLSILGYAAKGNAWNITDEVYTVENGLKGALIFVKPAEKSYRLGGQMLVSISITNASEKEIRLVDTEPKQDDYRVSAYLADGTPVRSPTTVVSDTSMSNGARSRSVLVIEPRQSVSMTLDLAKFTHFEKEGAYYLTVARRILTWDAGFVVSDKIKIDVVK
jgi:hypothetical protein